MVLEGLASFFTDLSLYQMIDPLTGHYSNSWKYPWPNDDETTKWNTYADVTESGGVGSLRPGTHSIWLIVLP